MKTLEGNIVDIIRKRIYSARIFFDTHIQKIEPLPDLIDGKFILPGLVDAHVHIESAMLPPAEFARLAVRNGVLAAVADPHEIANVLGRDGIDFMIENSDQIPFRFIFGAPSCVPATPFDNAGASIKDSDIDELFITGKACYLSEMMNFPGVLHHDPEVMAKIAVAHKHGKPVDGHAPGLTGEPLKYYIKSGISTDHECTALKEAEEKIRMGMKILIREGSAAKNFDALCPLIEKFPEQVMLCTDDCHPDDLIRGSIHSIIAKGVEKGLDVFSLLQAATLNPIKHYRINLGLLQTGDSADFVIVDNLNDFTVHQSFLQGVCLYDSAGENEDYFTARQEFTTYPNRFGASAISAPDIHIVASSGKMKVIQAFDGALFTKELIYDVPKGEPVVSDIKNDILKIIVVNRYHPIKPAVGFIHGFGLRKGALVTTVAHDSHHIIGVGCDDNSLVSVINHIIDLKGGLAAYYDQQLLDLKLDIAGLMSSAPGVDVARDYSLLNQAAAQMGCTLSSPFMTLSFMALLVIPELKIGDRGLFDVNKFNGTELF